MFNISKTEYKKIDKKSIVSEKAGLCFCQNYDKVTSYNEVRNFKYGQKTAQTKSRKVLYNKILSF